MAEQVARKLLAGCEKCRILGSLADSSDWFLVRCGGHDGYVFWLVYFLAPGCPRLQHAATWGGRHWNYVPGFAAFPQDGSIIRIPQAVIDAATTLVETLNDFV